MAVGLSKGLCILQRILNCISATTKCVLCKPLLIISAHFSFKFFYSATKFDVRFNTVNGSKMKCRLFLYKILDFYERKTTFHSEQSMI